MRPVQSKTQAQEITSIWDRVEPISRLAPGPMSRNRIVRAAVRLADEGGFEAVSLRSVAAKLGSGPMRLYAYLATKEELLDLMTDEVYRELLLEGDLPGGWRRAMKTHAERMRNICRKHPWFVRLLGNRPHMGPNGLRHLESVLASLYRSTEFLSIDEVLQALRTLNAYLLGAIHAEAYDVVFERESGLTKSEWQIAMAPHLERMIGTGRFPTLAKLLVEATHPSRDDQFRAGLECVLDGIAKRIKR